MRDAMKRIMTARSTQPSWWQAWLLRAFLLLFLLPLILPSPAIAQAVSFGPAADFTVGSIPFSVAIGDLSGDGKPDLAIANFNSDNVSILLGTGTGIFGAATNFAVGTNPLSVAIGDLNGDGKPDLAVANQTSDNVSILLGTGTGSFGAATNFVVGTSPQYVAIGDLNGDGKPDLAVTSNGSFTVSILLGTGTGSFGAATNFAVGSSPRTVAIGDLNGDGKPDLAVANVNSANVSVLLGTGTGAFGVATNFPVGTSPISVAIGDLNGDGKPDLATANGASTVSVLLGTGTGTFGVAVDYPVGSNPRVVTIGDLNGDGKLDLTVVNRNGPTVSILLGTGTGTFGAATNFPMGNSPNSLAIGDLNGDGKLDLATANGTSNDVSVRLNSTVFSPSGGFGVATNFAVGTVPLSIASGDLNRDGIPDLAIANYAGFSVSVLLGTGGGAFGTAMTFPLAGGNHTPQSVAIGDLDRDGKPDLALGSSCCGISVLLGAGSFGTAASVPASGPYSVAIGDLNGDGKPDLATVNITNNTVSVLLGDGTGTTFSPASGSPFPVGTEPISVAIGDLNGDGKQDLAVVNSHSDNVSVLLGSTIIPGAFGAATNFGVGSTPYSVAIGDLNGDGKPDLAVGNSDRRTASDPCIVSVLLGTGGGAFAATSDFAVECRPISVAIGDLNGDGKPDLAVVNDSNLSVSVLLGTGTGTFGTATTYALGVQPYWMAIGDFNRDGKPDLATANGISGNNVSILLNVGPPADLSLTKTDAPDPVTVSTALAYTVTVTNNGPNNATGVTVHDNLPAGVTFNAADSSPGCSAVGLAVTCTVGNLANAANTPRTIAVTAPAAPGLITNTASVTANEGEPTPGNNSATQQTIVRSVSPSADLQVVVADSPDPVTVGTNITYTMTVTNVGPDVATGVTLATAVPAGTTYVSATPSAGSCLGTTTITCTLGTMNIPASVLVTLIVTPTSAGTKSLTVSATADPVPPDANSANNTNILQTTLVTAAGVNTFVVNSTNDVNDGTCNATHCSLREAINAANATANAVGGPDVIVFNISGVGVQTINVGAGGLPLITQPVVIDGTTQPGYPGTPVIELNGAGAGVSADGLTLTSGLSTIRGLVINRFATSGIRITGALAIGNLLQGNYLGTNAAGTAALANGTAGVLLISGASSNTIGGTGAGAGNVISGNGANGVLILDSTTSGNVLQGNYIGTNAAGTAAIPNATGVFLNNGPSGTLIGGTTAGARNVISGNTTNGVRYEGGGGNLIQGNFIGTNAAGSSPLGNGNVGILKFGAGPGDLIGGTIGTTPGGSCTGACNLISGNGSRGISLQGPGPQGTVVLGNYIGTDVTGLTAIPNVAYGINILAGASNNTIGGLTPGARNIISGNTNAGVYIEGGGTTNNIVQGNYIGVNTVGTGALGNGPLGVRIVAGAQNNIIGGTVGTTPGGPCTGACNVISASGIAGVEIQGAGVTGNIVAGNYIGTNAAGTAALANLRGVEINASNNTIGGPTAAHRNVIAGNTHIGVRIAALNTVSTDGNVIQGNYIGVAADGSTALGNIGPGSGGIRVQSYSVAPWTANNTQILGNVIAGNAGTGIECCTGIFVDDGTNGSNMPTGTLIKGNFIGTNATGTAALTGQVTGVYLSFAVNSVIGGLTAAERNVISGNGTYGVLITGAGSTGNQVQGNYIGTNGLGTGPVGNGSNGAAIRFGASNNTIGGSTAIPGTGAGNVISGNSTGVNIVDAGTTGNKVQGNLIGTNAAGTTAIGSVAFGVLLYGGASGNTVGVDGDGLNDAGERNVISGNAYGVFVQNNADNNVIAGNYIGTNAGGTGPIPNTTEGVRIFDATVDNTRIGTNADGISDVLERNLISGNTNYNIDIAGGSGAVIAGNYIGTDVTGSASVGGGAGVVLQTGATNSRIGGTTAAARNVISGNVTNGIVLEGVGTTTNLIQGNYIGTNAAGTAALGNQTGISLTTGVTGNTIGGLTGVPGTAPGNVISGNTQNGIFILSVGDNSTLIQGNLIGLAANGTTSLSNGPGIPGTGGISASNGGARIGGTNVQARNVISSNTNGIILSTSGSNLGTLIQGNYIGTDITGNLNRGNGSTGVDIGNAPGTVVGGTVAGAGNVISGHSNAGVAVYFTGVGVLIQGNKIGVGADGTTPMANGSGVLIELGSSNATVGGTAPGAGNIIAFNLNRGIQLGSPAATGNAIEANAIFSNGLLGIDLGADGVTANDVGDGDTGANNLQNFPVLTSATNSGGLTTVLGTLNSTASSTFRVEVFANNTCDASGHGEGQTVLGVATVTTNGSGTGPISIAGLPAAVGQVVTATATNQTTNDTSEFSACVAVVSGVIQVPVATGQAPSTPEETATLITLAASDADSAALTFQIVGGVTHGTLSALGAPVCTPSGGGATCTAAVTYTPAGNYSGPDSFTFRASDGNQVSALALVTLTVTGQPDAPVAGADTVTVSANSGSTALDVLANDVDPDNLTTPFFAGLTVTAVTQPAAGQGSTTFTAGGVSYQPASGFSGTTSFSYTITDGSAFSSASVTVQVPSANSAALTVTTTGSGTVTGTGISCGADCTELYAIPAPPAAPTEITLTATPGLGVGFGGWGGVCVGTGACVVAMDRSQQVTASFSAPTVILTVALATGSGSGQIVTDAGGLTCGQACSGSFAPGTMVTLTAVPAAGSQLGAWGGACTGVTATSCPVTLTSALSVTASFTLAGLDDDADGLPNLDEGLQGSNPTNPDTDGDGVRDGIDNCPVTPNVGQGDHDGDAFHVADQRLGDACDPDADNDGRLDKQAQAAVGFVVSYVPIAVGAGGDNCPLTFNPLQGDADSDQRGNACDPDADGDGFGATFVDGQRPAELDLACCPEAGRLYDGMTGVPLGLFSGSVPAGQIRGGDCNDADPGQVPGVGACLITANAPPNQQQTDTDGDGLTLAQETALGTNPTLADTDGDGIGDLPDNCKRLSNATQLDADGDGVGNVCDLDADNDTIGDKTLNGDGVTYTATPVANGGDNCPLVANTTQANADTDGLGNACDTDADNDGRADKANDLTPLLVANGGDNCPLVANVDQRDSDGDGLGDVCDETRVPLPYQLTVTLPGYATWLPTDGGQAVVTLKVIETATLAEITTPITLTTVTVSQWPGHYTNDPNQGDVSDDMTYTRLGNVVTFTARDFGAKIVVQASASFMAEDGTPVTVATTFTLPQDENGNDLADAWEALYPGAALGRDADGDTSTGNTLLGDGLSNLAEYRGVLWDTFQVTAGTVGGTYYTTAYVPTGVVQHLRTSPRRKDVFVTYTGYSGANPFALGEAFANNGIDVHAIDTGLMTANPAVSATALDVVQVTNNLATPYGFEDGHINKTGVRAWSWDTKGDSVVGTGAVYGSNTTTYQMAATNYFAEKPYRDGGAGAAANNTLDVTSAVEDTNDNATKDSREDKDNDNALDNDLYVTTFLTSPQQLSVHDINKNGRVELPLVTTLVPGTTPEYTPEQVLKHTITHELAHALGINHTNDATCLMYTYSVDWKRDGTLSSVAQGQVKIHNQ